MNRFKRLKYAISLVLCLIGFLLPSRVYALSLSDVDNRTDEELANDEWETREVNANKNSVKCGLWSILVSTVWRGYGHHCIGDDSSHYKLLTMEGVSLGMLATSLIIGSLSNDDKALSAVWKSLFHYGTTLFIASYIFDVFGTFKGDTFTLAENHLDPYGHTIDFQFRWLPSSDFNFGLQLGYVYRNPRMWVNPYAYLEVTPFEEYSVGLDTGVALWYGEKTHTYVALAVDAMYDDHFESGYQNIKILPYIEFSLDLGSWFGHLANFRYINRLGVGVNLYNFEVEDIKAFSDHDTVLVLESGLNLNVIKDLNLAFIYRYRPDFVVGQISAPSRLYQTVPVPGVGIFSLDLDFNISGGWLASVDANFGNSIDFWIGVRKHF